MRQSAPAAPTRAGPIGRYLDSGTPEALFVLSALAQYTGASIAVLLFDEVEPQAVAWFRVIGAALAVLAVSRSGWRDWSRRDLGAVAIFGTATALMNLFFYLGIDRLDLGKSVAIEFIGPIAVAAATTRTSRNAVALAFAACGVLVLGGVEVDKNAVGLLFVLAASAMWAAYIVVGARVAQVTSGLTGLGIGLAIGAVVIAPVGAPWSGPVWASARLLGLCLLVGVFSNAIAYGIDQHVMRRIPVRRFSLLLALLPVTAVAVGWLVLDQPPSPLDCAGITLVLIGVAAQEREHLAVELEPG